jgi:hypothetical protein
VTEVPKSEHRPGCPCARCRAFAYGYQLARRHSAKRADEIRKALLPVAPVLGAVRVEEQQ